MEKAIFESYEIGESRFEEQGSALAEELDGMCIERGCGEALYDPGAESGNTRVTSATS